MWRGSDNSVGGGAVFLILNSRLWSLYPVTNPERKQAA